MDPSQSIDSDLEVEEHHSDAGIPADLATFQRRESWLDRALRLGFLEDEQPTF